MPPPPNAPGRLPRGPSPKEKAPGGGLRWKRRLRLGVRRWNPAGPRFQRCAACCKRLTRKTRRELQEPAFIFGHHALIAGQTICASHAQYPLVPCSGCNHELYEIPGDSREGGVKYVNRRGEPQRECPFCWREL